MCEVLSEFLRVCKSGIFPTLSLSVSEVKGRKMYKEIQRKKRNGLMRSFLETASMMLPRNLDSSKVVPQKFLPAVFKHEQ